MRRKVDYKDKAVIGKRGNEKIEKKKEDNTFLSGGPKAQQ